jgi:hypothetical protein
MPSASPRRCDPRYRVGIERIAAYEHTLLEYATPRLADIEGVRLVGTAEEKASVLSFVLAATQSAASPKAKWPSNPENGDGPRGRRRRVTICATRNLVFPCCVRIIDAVTVTDAPKPGPHLAM